MHSKCEKFSASIQTKQLCVESQLLSWQCALVRRLSRLATFTAGPEGQCNEQKGLSPLDAHNAPSLSGLDLELLAGLTLLKIDILEIIPCGVLKYGSALRADQSRCRALAECGSENRSFGDSLFAHIQ